MRRLGVAMVVGILRPASERTALVLLAFLCTGLASARLIGVALDGGLSAYTVSALVFEIGSSATALAFLRHEENA